MSADTPWFEDRGVDERPARRPRWILRILILLALAMVMEGVRAQVPPLVNGNECRIVAEMVMSGRALDRHGVKGEQFDKIMEDFYRPLLDGPAGLRVAIYLTAVKRFVSRPEASAIAPHQLGDEFATACRESRGDVSKIFGVGI